MMLSKHLLPLFFVGRTKTVNILTIMKNPKRQYFSYERNRQGYDMLLEGEEENEEL